MRMRLVLYRVRWRFIEVPIGMKEKFGICLESSSSITLIYEDCLPIMDLRVILYEKISHLRVIRKLDTTRRKKGSSQNLFNSVKLSGTSNTLFPHGTAQAKVNPVYQNHSSSNPQSHRRMLRNRNPSRNQKSYYLWDIGCTLQREERNRNAC